MKTLLLTFFLAFSLVTQAQDVVITNSETTFVVLEGCKNTEDVEQCYAKTLADFIVKYIDKPTIESLINATELDTITVLTSLRYDDFGELIKSQTKATSIDLNFDNKLSALFNEKLPRATPAIDSEGHTIMKTIKKTLAFKLDRTAIELIPLYDYSVEEIPFVVVEQVPVYEGCDDKMSNEMQRRCMSSKIGAVVSKNFDAGLASKLGLSPGYINIFASFKIDKKGKVIDIRARAPHPALEKEAKRILELIPDMKKPGIHKGQPVTVPYMLPIRFQVTADTKSENKN